MLGRRKPHPAFGGRLTGHRSVERATAGWGRYPIETCRLFRPERTAELRSLVLDPVAAPTLISRGLGRSYGDSALNPAGVVLHERLNRLLAFDDTTGVLSCEAGVSLAEIIDVFLPRGWFLPTTPGTKFVTVGGAIAADAHGKNHHVDGTFGQAVLDITLLTADGTILRCAPNGEHADVFWATVGGMGLTGVILSARFTLRPVQSAYITVEYKRLANLDAALDAFGDDAKHRYSVAWIDCLAGGKSLGRSVLMRGDHALAADVRAADVRATDPLRAPSKRAKTVPFDLPGFALSPLSVKAFNTVFYAVHSNGVKLVDYDKFFYPLDSIHHWNRAYGKRGFVQYQAFFPKTTSRQGLIRLLERLSSARCASFLAVLKSSGPGNPGLLSFLREGHTLALDIPFTPKVPALLAELDRILLDHDGRLYLAKDATMTADVFAAMYADLPRFKAIKDRLDPRHRFASTQARRVGIVS